MVDDRGDDVVAGLQQSVQRQVQTVRAVEGEDDSLGAFGPQQFGDPLAAALDDGRGFDRGAVCAPSDGSADPAVVIVYRRVDASGFGITRGGVVEINSVQLAHSSGVYDNLPAEPKARWNYHAKAQRRKEYQASAAWLPHSAPTASSTVQW